jgi:hypothetical protein
MRNAHFATLRERLLREGVAPKHVRRTVAELEAHRQDIVAELLARGVPAEQANADARARLGSDDTLAASVLARPELRSWARKRPWAAFTIVPVVSFLAAMALWIFAFVLLVDTLKTTFGLALLELSGVRPVTEFLFGAAIWGLPVVVGAWCTWFAQTRRAGVAWPIAGVVVIALVGSVLNMSLTWPEPPAKPTFSAGAGFGTDHLAEPAMRAGLTMALVLIPFLAWRRLRSVK